MEFMLERVRYVVPPPSLLFLCRVTVLATNQPVVNEKGEWSRSSSWFVTSLEVAPNNGIVLRFLLSFGDMYFMLVFSLDDSETERDEQSGTTPAPSKKKCLFDDSIVGKVRSMFLIKWIWGQFIQELQRYCYFYFYFFLIKGIVINLIILFLCCLHVGCCRWKWIKKKKHVVSCIGNVCLFIGLFWKFSIFLPFNYKSQFLLSVIISLWSKLLELLHRYRWNWMIALELHQEGLWWSMCFLVIWSSLFLFP